MARLIGRCLLVLLLLLPTTVFFVGQSKIRPSSNVAFADDSMEGEEQDATVETDDGIGAAAEDTGEDTDSTGSDQDEEEKAPKASPDADAFILFTKPAGNGLELPAGKDVRLLVGFTNKGHGEFVVESLEASFRYPQDYSFYLQNFTTASFNRVVESKRQATFHYGFIPNEAFSGRPFGLVVSINYRDGQGYNYQSAVFNDTIQVVDPDEGLDGETFFLYVFLAAVVILLLVAAQHLVSSLGKKHLSKPRPAVEMGTQNADIDYDWIPKETIKEMNRSPGRRSPKQSPRQRRSKRSAGATED